MKVGHKLFVTVNYGFDYSKGQLHHLLIFDILTQFFEHRNNLKGFIEDEEGPKLVEGSEVAGILDSFYEGFDNKNVPKVVEDYLLEFEMYEVLAEYHSPLEGEAIAYKEELLALIKN